MLYVWHTEGYRQPEAVLLSGNTPEGFAVILRVVVYILLKTALLIILLINERIYGNNTIMQDTA